MDIWGFINVLLLYISPIVALLGIVINNTLAYKRQKEERSIKFKLELIESLYSSYSDIEESCILILSSAEKRLFEIYEEVLFDGSESKRINYEFELYELTKKAILFSVYKHRLIEAYKLNIHPDDLTHYVCDVTKRIKSYSQVISYITKLYIVKYYEYVDINLATETVIKALSEEIDLNKKFFNDEISEAELEDFQERKNKEIEDYSSIIITFDDVERHKISEPINKIIYSYIKNLKDLGAEPLETFEKQVASAINRLVK